MGGKWTLFLVVEGGGSCLSSYGVGFGGAERRLKRVLVMAEKESD